MDKILEILDDEEKITSEVARELGVNTSTAYAKLVRLEKLGKVERRYFGEWWWRRK